MFSSMLSLLGSLRRGNFITNSLRFRSSASANLSRTPSVVGNRQAWTWSAWVKRGTLGEYALFGATLDASNRTFIRFNSSDQLDVRRVDGGTSTGNTTTAVFRDCSAWYHVVISVDFSQASAASRAIIYVNGVQQTLGTSSVASGSAIVNLNTAHRVGYNESSFYLDGYLTDVNFIDGQALTPASFGQIESTTGVWSPKQYVGSYGTNGFYLKFGNTSSVAALGTDSSGNGNTWTVNNVSLTAGATYDSMIDVPVNYSDGGNGRGNYAVLNPVSSLFLNSTASSGNLQVVTNSGTDVAIPSTMYVSSGKWYAEFTHTVVTPSSNATGIIPTDHQYGSGIGFTARSYAYLSGTGNKYNNNINSAYGSSYTTNDIIGVALDMDNGMLWFSKNGVWQNSGVPSTLVNPAFTGISGEYTLACGDNSGAASATIVANFGQRPFTYTPPAGFLALNTNNLPTPSIVNGANFMAATTYTGNAAARSLSNAVNSVSFQPDLVWIKSRTPGATSHALFDSTRGTTKYLSSNTTTGETTLAQSLTAFGADGFSLGTDTTLVNANANSYVAWQWKAGGAAVSNTQGTITSQVSANTTSGISSITWTGNGVNNSTIGHGLTAAPVMIISKSTNASQNWYVWHASLSGNNYGLALNSPNAQDAFIFGNFGTKTSSTLQLVTGSSGSENVNLLNRTYVAYCFAQIAGFSRFGSYTGNGSADGPFVFCGFRPRFVMIKRTDAGNDWVILDTSRNTYNFADSILWADLANVETSGTATTSIDCLSNGFKSRGAGSSINATNGTYIFAAFAEVPSKYALAR